MSGYNGLKLLSNVGLSQLAIHNHLKITISRIDQCLYDITHFRYTYQLNP